MGNSPQTFIEFLEEYYLENEDEGRSHNSSSAQENFEHWFENLQLDELVEFGDEFAATIRKEIKK